jgi:hypothetical protein
MNRWLLPVGALQGRVLWALWKAREFKVQRMQLRMFCFES